MLGLSLLLSIVAAAPAPPASPGVTVIVGVADERRLSAAAAHVGDVRRPADSIILVRTGGGTVRALWIPRETQLRLPGGGTTSASRALRDGGTARLDAALSATLGILPDRHALLDIRGFAALVDAAGGVRWPGGHSRIGLPSRPRLLGGRETVSYAGAARRGIAADILRIRRQMALARAFQKSLPAGGLSEMLRAAAILPSAGRTDLSPVAAARLTLALASDPLRCALLAGDAQGPAYRPAPSAGAAARRLLDVDSERQYDRGRRAFS